ncbi:MAG: peptidylprolyl isomerase [bacterium]|nr:peptidylprolyl isomerase [bacterium]
MSRRPVIACALALAAIALLSLPASAGHHEAGESGKKPEAPAPHRLSDEDLTRVTTNATETAPEKFKVEFDTTKGKIVLEVHREWSPNGVDRFYNLVKIGYYEDIAFFRVIQGFMAQFGLHGDPRVTRVWNRRAIKDDPVKQSNLRGYVTFAKRNQRNSRTTQLFINLVDNKGLDRQGFAPFAQVVEGMDIVDSIFAVGEGGPRGPGPNQRQITAQGNAYLKKQFPKLDYLKSARIVE